MIRDNGNLFSWERSALNGIKARGEPGYVRVTSLTVAKEFSFESSDDRELSRAFHAPHLPIIFTINIYAHLSEKTEYFVMDTDWFLPYLEQSSLMPSAWKLRAQFWANAFLESSDVWLVQEGYDLLRTIKATEREST